MKQMPGLEVVWLKFIEIFEYICKQAGIPDIIIFIIETKLNNKINYLLAIIIILKFLICWNFFFFYFILL